MWCFLYFVNKFGRYVTGDHRQTDFKKILYVKLDASIIRVICVGSRNIYY